MYINYPYFSSFVSFLVINMWFCFPRGYSLFSHFGHPYCVFFCTFLQKRVCCLPMINLGLSLSMICCLKRLYAKELKEMRNVRPTAIISLLHNMVTHYSLIYCFWSMPLSCCYVLVYIIYFHPDEPPFLYYLTFFLQIWLIFQLPL